MTRYSIINLEGEIYIQKNRKILKVGLAIISLSLVLSMIFARLIRLDQPVFFKNYMELKVLDKDEYYPFENEFIIRYITNVNDNRSVVDIKFEATDMGFYIDNSYGRGFSDFFADANDEKIYGRYIVRTISVRPDFYTRDSLFEELELGNADIIFNNGDILNVDLGKIMYYKEDNSNEHIEFVESGGASDGTGYSRFNIMEDIAIEKIDYRLLDYIKEDIEIEICDKEYLAIEGTELKKGDMCRVSYTEKFNEDVLKRYNSYNVPVKLHFKDINKDSHEENILTVLHEPFDFKFIEILKYLRARGEI